MSEFAFTLILLRVKTQALLNFFEVNMCFRIVPKGSIRAVDQVSILLPHRSTWHSQSPSSRAANVAKRKLLAQTPLHSSDFFQLRQRYDQNCSPGNFSRAFNASSRAFSITPQVSAEFWTKFLRGIEAYRKDDLLVQADKLTSEAVKWCLTGLRSSFFESSTLPELAGKLSEELAQITAREKKISTRPLSKALSEIGLSHPDFIYDEDLFLEQIATPPSRPDYLVNLAQLLLSPSFNTLNNYPIISENEQFKLNNYSDLNWTRYIGGLSLQSIVLPDEDENVENRTFNQFACDSVKTTETFLRELAGGNGDRALTISCALARQKKYPSAILASDINQFSVLIGNLALSALKCHDGPIRIGLGHLTGEFYYPENSKHKDQVILMSRALTVCDAKTTGHIFHHLNHSLKIGDRIIASFALPQGGLEYEKYQGLVKSDPSFVVTPMGSGLVGETFWQTFNLSPHEMTYYNRSFRNFEPRVAIHSFVDITRNKHFFEKRGFELTRYVRLTRTGHSNGITNDREIVEFTKRKELR